MISRLLELLTWGRIRNKPVFREVLTAARTYYVRTDGNDSNTGLVDSAGGAFLTYAKAKAVAQTIDINGQVLTIQMGAGTWTSPIILFDVVGYWGVGSCLLVGDTAAPTNVVLSVNSATYGALHVEMISTIWEVKGFQYTNSAGNCVYVIGGKLYLHEADFGASGAGFAHIFTSFDGFFDARANYSVSGAAGYHWMAQGKSHLRVISRTITITGTPAFTAWALSSGIALIPCGGNTFTGSATGQRYNASGNSVINSSGGGAGYLPGNAAGATATGGQYL